MFHKEFEASLHEFVVGIWLGQLRENWIVPPRFLTHFSNFPSNTYFGGFLLAVRASTYTVSGEGTLRMLSLSTLSHGTAECPQELKLLHFFVSEIVAKCTVSCGREIDFELLVGNVSTILISADRLNGSVVCWSCIHIRFVSRFTIVGTHVSWVNNVATYMHDIHVLHIEQQLSAKLYS